MYQHYLQEEFLLYVNWRNLEYIYYIFFGSNRRMLFVQISLTEEIDDQTFRNTFLWKNEGEDNI